MRCKKCGLPSRIVCYGENSRNHQQLEYDLNIHGRWRECDNGHRTKTLEIDAAEVAELRRKAYLHELQSRQQIREAA